MVFLKPHLQENMKRIGLKEKEKGRKKFASNERLFMWSDYT
jgi:hypothetical protein